MQRGGVPGRMAALCLMRGSLQQQQQQQQQQCLSSFSRAALLAQPACLTLLRRACTSARRQSPLPTAQPTYKAVPQNTALHRFMSSRLLSPPAMPAALTARRMMSTHHRLTGHPEWRVPSSAAAAALVRPRTNASGFLPARSTPTCFYSSTHNCAIYALQHITRGHHYHHHTITTTTTTAASSSIVTHGARFSIGSPSRGLLAPKKNTTTSTTATGEKSAAANGASSNLPQVTYTVDRYRTEEENEEERRRREAGGEESEEDMFNRNAGPGYLPFRPPFHTINIVMILLIANVLCYALMNFANDDWRDWLVEHCTMSHENWWRVYPIFTNALYQENLLQLLIDCWLLMQFGETMLNFLGNVRLTFFALLCTATGSFIHIARQKFELYYGKDELEVRGRCYGPNPFIMGLIAVEGLIFRHLNFIQQPPVPFLVLTAFVMVIDVWRIFTILPEEHGAATGGALVAYLFWALPTRMLGLDKLTAAL